MTVRVTRLFGKEIGPVLADLARLRIEVFRAFPYLYDGDFEYEARYLHDYAKAQDSVLVIAAEGDTIVGAATAAPMRHQNVKFRAPFESRGFDTEKLFYFGESVLLPDFRGRGIGHAFFDHREAHAKERGATAACFAAVVRSDEHPAKPADYRPLDAFWAGRSYARIEGLQTGLSWLDLNEAAESEKLMQYWIRQW